MLYMYSYLQSIKIFPSFILCISLYATQHFKTSKFNQMRYVHMGKIALHCTWKGLSCFKFNSDGEFYKLSFNILSWKIVNIKWNVVMITYGYKDECSFSLKEVIIMKQDIRYYHKTLRYFNDRKYYTF